MKRTALAVLFTCLVLLTGCSPMVPDPLEKATTTLVPGTNTQIHSPIAQQETGDTYNAVLYFRFMQEDLLAQESRKIHVSMDQSLEKSLVAALMQGPGASSPELRRLFSGQVAVISTLSQGNTLFVTLSESVLLEPMVDRFLQMQSLSATLCEI